MTIDPAILRAATEDTVASAIARGGLEIDSDGTTLLELFNQMLDLLGVPDADGDTCDLASASDA